MILESLRLDNITSFQEERIEFSRGINIIAGRNGTGKSTIIEAVGLALFDEWPARFKEGNAYTGLLRNGTAEGGIELVLRVKDSRYRIICELGQRNRRGKEATVVYERRLFDGEGHEISASSGRKTEFQQDIRQHCIGFARIGDDRLFRDIIGTRQGAFDEPFTQSESDRRELFEKILGIKDFQDFEKQFRAFVARRQTDARSMEERAHFLSDTPLQLSRAREEAAKRARELQEIQVLLAERSQEAVALDRQCADMEKRRQEIQALEAGLRLTEQKRLAAAERLARARNNLETTAQAVALAASLEGPSGKFQEAERRIAELSMLRDERDRLAQDAQKRAHDLELRLTRTSAERSQWQRDLQKLDAEARAATEERDSLASSKSGTERELSALSERGRSAAAEKGLLDETLRYARTLRDTTKALLDAGATIASLRDEFARIETAVREFTRGGPANPVQPYLPPLKDASRELLARRIEQEGARGGIEPLDRLIEEMEEDLARRTAAVEGIMRAMAGKEAERTSVAGRIEEAERRLAAMATKRVETAAELQRSEDALAASAKEKEALVAGSEARMRKYGTVDTDLAAADAQKREHADAHRRRIEALALSSRHTEHTEEVAAATSDAAAAEREYTEAVSRRTRAGGEPPEGGIAALRGKLEEARRMEREAHGAAEALKRDCEHARDAAERAAAENARFEELTREGRALAREAEYFGDVHAEVIRMLAQRVGASIVESVSAFARDVYRRIVPDQPALLHWDPFTYAIELRSDHGVVRGRELSGGQLMGVSLAVKLALIKWYAECRIGFLDEPTTHLDREARMHLAQVVEHLNELTTDEEPWFDQLFIISHEESFAGAGNRIELSWSQGNGSRVIREE